MSDDRPFYLTDQGENIITQEDIEQFLAYNPELTPYFQKNTIELKVLPYSHFESFCYWIMGQQISGYVANKLVKRFQGLFNGDIKPQKVLEKSDDELLEIGLSRSKVKYIKNVADFYNQSKNLTEHNKYSSNEILSHYTKIKGVGAWTVNMFLIFNLGRKDIFAPKDLVVRKGVKILYDLDTVPDEKATKELCNNWGELATIGTILAWAVMGE